MSAGSRYATPRVDYDKVAHLYDEAVRDHDVDPDLLAFLEAGHGGPERSVSVLDVGCGTGKQLAANRGRFPDAVLVGVDRFERMLRIALERCPGVFWLQADGATLPFRGEAFNYVTSQYSYQHVRRPRQLLSEVFRVLRPGGRFVMSNIDPWSMTGWIVYRYFPEALELDQRDFVPVDEFVALMRDLGFADIRVRREDLSRPESVRECLARASQRHRASQLMAISDASYTAGIGRLESALASAPGGDLVVRSAFVLVTVVGHRA